MSRKGEDLRRILERAQEGYAYEIMALQIQIEQNSGEQCSSQTISRLLQLYMVGVEILESKSDPRYKYFNAKIQTLVKKRIILEEMQRATQKLVENDLLKEAKRAELGQKKEDYNLQMYLNKDQITSKRIREFVDTAELKIKKIETRVRGAMINQDNQLEQRIKRRRMRSEAGSVEKFTVVKGQVIERNIAGLEIDDFFEPWSIKLAKRQPNSGQKQENAKSSSNNKNGII